MGANNERLHPRGSLITTHGGLYRLLVCSGDSDCGDDGMSEHICNAIIESAEITFDRGIFLSAWVFLDYGGSGQGFGGYVLGADPYETSRANNHAEQPNLAAEFIAGVMSVAGVEKWSALKGKVVRVIRAEEGFGGQILGIGHPTKDKWFRPDSAPAFQVLPEKRK